MDTWSDQNRRSYLAITGHWIGHVGETSSLQLKATVIAFHRLRGSHEGKSLSKVTINLLDRVGVTVKVRVEPQIVNLRIVIYITLRPVILPLIMPETMALQCRR